MKISVDDVEVGKVIRKTGPIEVSELADSIDEVGLISPITVRKKGNKYELVAGLRRLLAVKELGYQEIEADVREINDLDSLRISIIENRERSDVDPFDYARACQSYCEKYRELYGRDKSMKEIASSLTISKQKLFNTIGLLDISEEAKKAATDRAKASWVPGRSTLEEIAPSVKKVPEEKQASTIEIIREKQLNRKEARKFIEAVGAYPEKRAEDVAREHFAKPSGYTLSVYFSVAVSRALDDASTDRDAAREEIVQIAVEDWLRRKKYLK